ncbi:MAG TPA: response regulator [Polyangiaceae bacterium]|nr:response regulator [Polyangiaceae bacterium]
MIVEDSATQAHALEIVLTSEGFEVELASDGEAALALLATQHVDLIVSDIVMPGISGYELCRRLKSHHATKDIPVVLLTTLSDPLDIIQGLESGADNFITKPYDPSYLVARIHALLTSRRLRQNRKLQMGIEIFFLGKPFVITSEKEQILDLLLCTFEDIVRTNRELQQSKNALARANQELEAFSYSVSHDLRAPLRAIDGFSHALASECADSLGDEGIGYLKHIRSAVTRMAQLIDDLLALAHVSRAQLRRSPVRLDELARACAEVLANSEPGREVTWVIPAQLPADGDPSLLRIVLENLLGNAWKFTRKAPRACIEIGSEPPGPDNEPIYFVRDNGAGFDMAHAEKLFAPFQRLHSNAEFQGTGVGLATVQRIIHRHGGRVWAEAEPQRGATFFFTLGEAGS